MTKVNKFSCGHEDCILHNTLEEAQECALSQVHEKIAYQCDVCGVCYEEESTCHACCSEERWEGALARAKERLERVKSNREYVVGIPAVMLYEDKILRIECNIAVIENKLKKIRKFTKA